MRLFVNNLEKHFNDSDLDDLFGHFGKVLSAQIITDPETKISRGFGFVEMAKDHEGLLAIQELNGKKIGNITIFVSKANPKK